MCASSRGVLSSHYLRTKDFYIRSSGAVFVGYDILRELGREKQKICLSKVYWWYLNAKCNNLQT